VASANPISLAISSPLAAPGIVLKIAPTLAIGVRLCLPSNMSKVFQLHMIISGTGGMLIKAVFILIIIASFVLCSQSNAQTTAQEWIDQGFSLYSQGKYDASLQAFDRAIALDHENADAWYNKGVVLFDQGKINDSLQAFNRSIGINPLDADAWYNKGSALAALGRSTEADDAFAKAGELDVFKKSSGLRSEDQSSSTPTELTTDEIDAGTAEQWYENGIAFADQGLYDEAIRAYDKAIKLNPHLTRAWAAKGQALEIQGKESDAFKAFDEAIRLDKHLTISQSSA